MTLPRFLQLYLSRKSIRHDRKLKRSYKLSNPSRTKRYFFIPTWVQKDFINKVMHFCGYVKINTVKWGKIIDVPSVPGIQIGVRPKIQKPKYRYMYWEYWSWFKGLNKKRNDEYKIFLSNIICYLVIHILTH